jgi:Uma2 family endonuclease
MTAANRVAPISVEEYLANELRSNVRHEYLGGQAYRQATESGVHDCVARALCDLLSAQLLGEPSVLFDSGMKVRVTLPTDTRFYYPDAVVVRGPNAVDGLFQKDPVVVAEVLSEKTRRYDEVEKCGGYLTIPALKQYVLIETASPRVTVFRRNETEPHFVADAYDGLGAVIPLPAIAAELRLADLYARVDFEAVEAEPDETPTD